MGEIRKYKDLVAAVKDLSDKLPLAPMHRTFSITVDGRLEIDLEDDTAWLQPEEALRLGKFLVEFYGGVEESDG